MGRASARRSRPAGPCRRRAALLALALAACAWIPGAAAAQPAVAGGDAPLAETASDLLPDLEALGRGELAEGVAVSSLFAVRLDRLSEVEQRGTALQAERDAIDARLEVLRALPTVEPEVDLEGEAPPTSIAVVSAIAAEVASLEARRAMAGARLAYLSALAERLRAMPEAARRILPGIGEPRAALRERADATAALGGALVALAERVEDLALRLDSGTLVGFRTDARKAAELLRADAPALRARGERLRAVAADELALAAHLEAGGRALRRTFFVTILAPDREARMDALFLEHLAEQRRLHRGAGEAPAVERSALDAFSAAVRDTLPRPDRVGTVERADRVQDSLGELVARADEVTLASRAARDGWRLAFENEIVTVLSGQISAETRREAYAFSQSLLRDVRSEAALAWERVRAFWSEWDPRAEGRLPGLLLRLLGLAAVAAAWWAARRATPRSVTRAVREIARWAGGRYGIRVGTLVRWSGLAQSVIPVLLLYPALRAWMMLLRDSGSAAEMVRAIGMPFFAYLLGRQLLLGLTQRITWGRPALIEVSSSRLPALRRTYARLGLFVATAMALDGFARIVIGEGVIVLLVDALALLWVGVWAAWEAYEWRPALAEAWQGMLPDAGFRRERSLAEWMGRSRLGLLLSPWVVLRGAVVWLVGAVVALVRRTDLAELLAARRLRRAAKSEEASSDGDSDIPEVYLREFPLRPILGQDDALLLPREEAVSEIVGRIDPWRETKGEGSIALIGEKGSGKTTLAALVARRLDASEVVQHTVRGKPVDEEALFRELSPQLPVDGVSGMREWIEGLCAGPERIVLLDECHNVFLRTVGGYRGYDALVYLVNATSSRIFWVLLFNSFTWRFLNESRSRLHYFRKLVHMPAWSADDLRDLIRRRNQQTGFEVEFDEMLLGGDRTGVGLELVEGAEGYFRLLRETSGGNPRIATRLWLSSLSVIGEKKLRVSAFREPSSTALDDMSDELLFALAAISQHENLSTDELRRVLNVSDGLARFAMQYLGEAGLVVAKDGSTDRVTLSAPLYRQTLRALRKKHLLFE